MGYWVSCIVALVTSCLSTLSAEAVTLPLPYLVGTESPLYSESWDFGVPVPLASLQIDMAGRINFPIVQDQNGSPRTITINDNTGVACSMSSFCSQGLVSFGTEL